MKSSLRSSARRGGVRRGGVRRGVTVLVGAALFGLAASGVAQTTTMVAHGAGEPQANAYSMRAFEGGRDGGDVYMDVVVAIASGHVTQSIESLRKGGFCDFTPAC